MPLFGSRRRSHVPTPAPRLETDPALENRREEDRLAPYVKMGYVGEELVCDYVPITVRGARYYLTSVSRPTTKHLVDVVADDAHGDSHMLSNVRADTLPASVYNAFFAAGWYTSELAED